MAKIDEQLKAIEIGFSNPEVRIGTTWVDDATMEELKVRRASGSAGALQHRLWYISVGETNQTPAFTGWGRSFSDAFRKVLAWKDLPTKSTRGRKPMAE